MAFHSTLAELREATLAMLGESEISNSEWRFTDAAPYKNLDMLINNAEIALGHELLLKGCRSELILRANGHVYSADSEYLSWAAIEWATIRGSGTAPSDYQPRLASKIIRIIDATNSNCKFTIPMVHASQEEALNPSGPLNFNRYGLNAAAGTGPIAILYQDYLKILPKSGQARTLDIEYIDQFGQIGKLRYATVSASGSSYETAPTVTVTGDGTGGAIAATVTAAGAVQSLYPANPGSGYTTATLSFSGGGGADAAGTVTIGESALPSESIMAHATWAAMLALVQKQRDASGLRVQLYGDNRDIGDIQRLVQSLHNGRAGVIANNRPQYQGP